MITCMESNELLTYANDTSNEQPNMIKTSRVNWTELALNFKTSRSEKDFKILFDKIHRPMLKYVNGLVMSLPINNPDSLFKFISVNDIVMSTMQIVYSKISQYDPEWKFSTWVHTIARNVTNLHIRKAKAEMIKRNRVTVSLENETYRINEDLVDSSHRENIIKTTYQKVLDSINELPDIFRNIIHDRDVNGLTYQNIADKYDLPINTVKSRIRNGHARLRTMVFQDKTINKYEIQEYLS